MNQWHYNKIKQLKDWRSDLNAVLVFAKTDEETRKETIKYINLLDYAIEQIERVRELEDAVESYKKTSRHANISHKMAEEQNKRYREALEFYADEENYLFDEKEYKVGLGVPESEITLDYGNKAREALEDEEWVKNGWKKLS